MTSDKLQKLFALLERSPRDAFLLYGIGMEYKKLGDLPRAIEYFDQTLGVDAGYCYAYYQRGQVQEMQGDGAAAKKSYAYGMAAAERVGDNHARSELEAAMQMLE